MVWEIKTATRSPADYIYEELESINLQQTAFTVSEQIFIQTGNYTNRRLSSGLDQADPGSRLSLKVTDVRKTIEQLQEDQTQRFPEKDEFSWCWVSLLWTSTCFKSSRLSSAAGSDLLSDSSEQQVHLLKIFGMGVWIRCSLTFCGGPCPRQLYITMRRHHHHHLRHCSRFQMLSVSSFLRSQCFEVSKEISAEIQVRPTLSRTWISETWLDRRLC